jgi:hypothetical protein
MRRQAKILLGSSLPSLRRAASVFNGYDEDGRVTTVLLHLQHAFEMLLKAGLVQKRLEVFDKRSGRSIGFERCVNLSMQHLGVTADEAGLLKAVDALRDEAQHWFAEVSEPLLYTHLRGAVTLYDRLLGEVFEQTLADHLPGRVLPISTDSPRDIQQLFDEEFSQAKALLGPNVRKRPDARARIRTLLAMEAHALDDDAEGGSAVRVSERDVDRVERAIKAGAARTAVFPRLSNLGTEVAGEGLDVRVTFVREGGAPVQIVAADAQVDAAAIRDRDLQKVFKFGRQPLAKKLGITTTKAKALRWKLGIDEDPKCLHVFRFGGSEHPQYSDEALKRMRTYLSEHSIDDVYAEYKSAQAGGA